MSYRVVDLFCGCGGLTRGLSDAGFDVIAGFDQWRPALEVYRANIRPDHIHDHEAYEEDLSNEEMIKGMIKILKPDVIAGGPPCQDYSSAGNREEGERAQLTLTFARVVTYHSPKAFIMENVPVADKSQTYQRAIEIFREGGYGLTKIVLDASLCGVPQKRKRLFLIGAKDAADDFLKGALIDNLRSEPMTIREFTKGEFPVEHYYRHPRTYERRAVYSVDEPSATIRGVNRPVPSTYKHHPNDTANAEEDKSIRALNTQERALIQSFPRDYNFEAYVDGKIVSKASLEQMIGNAVPPILAQYVARHLKEFLDNQFGITSGIKTVEGRVVAREFVEQIPFSFTQTQSLEAA